MLTLRREGSMELLQSKLLRGCGDALLKVIAMGNTEPPESWFCALSLHLPPSFLVSCHRWEDRREVGLKGAARTWGVTHQPGLKLG